MTADERANGATLGESSDGMTPDEKADLAIKAMVGTVVGTAIIPAHVNWALTAAALGSGVIAIGLCYGVKLNKEEAWQLVKQFFLAAGFWFIGMQVSSKIFAMILETTGIGYAPAVALDAALSGAIAWAIGETAKAYFKGVTNKKALGNVFKQSFVSAKAKLSEERARQQEAS
jgi:uncharacterized protein (DUF697 family)